MKWLRKQRESRKGDGKSGGNAGEKRSDQTTDNAVFQDAKDESTNYVLIEEKTDSKSTAKKNWAILRDAVFRRRYPRTRPTRREPESLRDAEREMDQPAYLRLAPLLLVFIGYLGIGTAVYSYGERWPVSKIYFLLLLPN